jgi:hypothetical protein
MNKVINIDDHRERFEKKKRIAAMGGPCGTCGEEMVPFEDGSPMHQLADEVFICPSCFSVRMVYQNA